MIGIKAIEEQNANDPIWIVPSSPLYISLYPNGLTKSQAEDLQILDWLSFIRGIAAIYSPVCIDVGGDPPDRLLTTPLGKLGVELRQLTLPRVRQELAPLRDYGQRLQARLQDEQNNFQHLVGKRLHITLIEANHTQNLDSNTQDLLKILVNDVGVVGEDVVINDDAGFPNQWPKTHRGFYGKIGQFMAQVYADGIPGDLLVSCAAQTQVRFSEAVNALSQAISEKDISGNDVILITCGLPDVRGFQCPLDQWLYNHIECNRSQITSTIQPKNVKSVILRLWNSHKVMELYRHQGLTMPWKTL